MVKPPHLPTPPKLGTAHSHIHVIWLAAFPDDPHEFYDELDDGRWSLRCVRIYRDRSAKRFDYNSPNWRDVMPEAATPLPEIINADSQFRARTISVDVFDAMWQHAEAQTGDTP